MTTPAAKAKAAASTTNPGSEGNMMDVLENTLWNRTLGSMSEEIVAALVCQIFEGIRDHFVQAVELKFNCFFLMPIIDAFPTRLREELEAAYEEDLDEVGDAGAGGRVLLQRRGTLTGARQQQQLRHDEPTPAAPPSCAPRLAQVFDVAAVRAALEQRLKSLESELHQVERLQRKFAMIHSTLAQQQTGGAKGEADTPKFRESSDNLLNVSRSSMPAGANLKVRGVGSRGRRRPCSQAAAAVFAFLQQCDFCTGQPHSISVPCPRPCRRLWTCPSSPRRWGPWSCQRAAACAPRVPRCGETGPSRPGGRRAAPGG